MEDRKKTLTQSERELMKAMPMSEIFKFLKSRIPSFKETACGADLGEIKKLEKFLKSPLPDDYKTFLQTCGKCDGGLFCTFLSNCTGYYFSIKNILEMNYTPKRGASTRYSKRPDNQIYIGSVSHAQDWHTYYTLDLKNPASPVKAKNIEYEKINFDRVEAPSFKEFICNVAFKSQA